LVTLVVDLALVIVVAHVFSIDGLAFFVGALVGLVGTPLVGLLLIAIRGRRWIGAAVLAGWLVSLPIIWMWAGWLSDQVGG